MELFPSKNKDALFHRACKNEFEWDISSYQAMGKGTFNKGYTQPGGTYIKTEDEETLDSIVKFLESIIKAN